MRLAGVCVIGNPKPGSLAIFGAYCSRLQNTVLNVLRIYPMTLNGALTVVSCNELKTKGSGAVMRVGYSRAAKPRGQLISQ